MPAELPTIAVACGVLVRADGHMLLAQRPEGKVAAGYWEFPGGKIEAGECAEAALRRELHEELGITVRAATPLIRFAHAYSNRRVVLDTWCVTAFDGQPQGRECQALQWVATAALGSIQPLLPTVLPTLKALALPTHYVFTRDVSNPLQDLALLSRLPRGALLRLRWPQLDDTRYAEAAAQWLPRAQRQGLRVLLDRSPALVTALQADGWHCSETRLRALDQAPVLPLCIASVHGSAGLALAVQQGFDAAVLGPVASTGTHPGAAVLGWQGFAQQRAEQALPVFAIGGLGPQMLERARLVNAQGIAAISAYWREGSSTT